VTVLISRDTAVLQKRVLVQFVKRCDIIIDESTGTNSSSSGDSNLNRLAYLPTIFFRIFKNYICVIVIETLVCVGRYL